MFSTKSVIKDLESVKLNIDLTTPSGKETLEQLENVIEHIKTLKQSPEEVVASIETLHELEEQLREAKKAFVRKKDLEKIEIVTLKVTNSKTKNVDEFFVKDKIEAEILLRKKMFETSLEDFEVTSFITDQKFVLESEYKEIEFTEVR